MTERRPLVIDEFVSYVSPGTKLGAEARAFAVRCYDEAEAMLGRYVQSVVGPTSKGVMLWAPSGMPQRVLNRAVTEVAAELFNRRNAPNGIAQFATAQGAPTVRVARDPMVAAYPLLAPYVGMGIA